MRVFVAELVEKRRCWHAEASSRQDLSQIWEVGNRSHTTLAEEGFTKVSCRIFKQGHSWQKESNLTICFQVFRRFPSESSGHLLTPYRSIFFVFFDPLPYVLFIRAQFLRIEPLPGRIAHSPIEFRSAELGMPTLCFIEKIATEYVSIAQWRKFETTPMIF